MEIQCQRDICIREKCPAVVCSSRECAKVCHNYVEVSNRKDEDLERLNRKYRNRKKKLKQSEFDKLDESRKADAIREQQAFDRERQAIDTEYLEKLYPFRPCGHKFEVPDDTPVGAIVICPFCKGENPISAVEKANALKKKAAAKPEIQELFW